MRASILLLILSTFHTVRALKGQQRQLRKLQDSPPAPKEGGVEPKAPKEDGLEPKAPKENVEPKAPKESEVGGPKESKDPKEADGKKDDKKANKKEKKCKKAPKQASEPAAQPNDAPEASPIIVEEPYCLQGDATEEECKAAKGGKVPKGHKSIKGDVEINISYVEGSSAVEVLDKVEQVIRSETGAEFIGCGKKGSSAERRRRLQDEDPPPETTDEETTDDATAEAEEEDVRVTGVDFTKVEISKDDCVSSESGRNCDVIASEVEIYYIGSDEDVELTAEEKEEMFALLASTIESQAASGAFDDVGNVESVEVVNTNGGEGGSSSGGGGGLGKRATAGIPSGIGGILAIAVAGCVIYKLLGRDRDENGIDESAAHNTDNAMASSPQRIIEAEAVVMDAIPDQKDNDGTYAKMKNQFL